jgi:hypothetical protein
MSARKYVSPLVFIESYKNVCSIKKANMSACIYVAPFCFNIITWMNNFLFVFNKKFKHIWVLGNMLPHWIFMKSHKWRKQKCVFNENSGIWVLGYMVPHFIYFFIESYQWNKTTIVFNEKFKHIFFLKKKSKTFEKVTHFIPMCIHLD